MSGKAASVWLAASTCQKGMLCWLESHPGTAAWLQGAGTLVALFVAVGAYIRFRREGFRPRIQARCNPDGLRAVLLLANLGRASGAVDELLVGKAKPWPRRGVEPGYRLVMRPQRSGQVPPCTVGAGESMRLLLDADADKYLFIDKSLRIAVILGTDVKNVRIKQLRRPLNTTPFEDPANQAQVNAQLPDAVNTVAAEDTTKWEPHSGPDAASSRDDRQEHA